MLELDRIHYLVRRLLMSGFNDNSTVINELEPTMIYTWTENLDIAHTWTENLNIAHTWTENLEISHSSHIPEEGKLTVG